MHQVCSYDYILIGLLLRYLQNPSGLSQKEIGEAYFNLLSALVSSQFNVSVNGIKDISKFLDSIDFNSKIPLLDSQNTKLIGIVNTLEKIIYAEAQSKNMFYITEKRYNIDYLLHHPERIFPNGLFEKLTDLTKYDFKEAFLCILYERPTAAAFHMLRATESVLRDLYYLKIKRNRVTNPTWGSILKIFTDNKRNRIDQTLLGNLLNIKDSYRNPSMHPESIFNNDQAQDLLGLCIDVVTKMTKEIEKRKKFVKKNNE